jgi:hypothetical protein
MSLPIVGREMETEVELDIYKARGDEGLMNEMIEDIR